MDKAIKTSGAINRSYTYTKDGSYCLVQITYANGSQSTERHHEHWWDKHSDNFFDHVDEERDD